MSIYNYDGLFSKDLVRRFERSKIMRMLSVGDTVLHCSNYSEGQSSCALFLLFLIVEKNLFFVMEKEIMGRTKRRSYSWTNEWRELKEE